MTLSFDNSGFGKWDVTNRFGHPFLTMAGSAISRCSRLTAGFAESHSESSLFIDIAEVEGSR